MRVPRPPAILIVLCLGAGSCASSPPAAGSAIPSRPASNATTAALLPVDALSLPTFDVDRYRQLIDQLRGTPVVVNIWASWCGPCREEAPHLAAAARHLGASVQFLGVDILDSRTSARSFIERYGWTYPSLFDETGAIRDQLGLIGQPATVFYDATGRVVSTWSGAISADLLTRRLQQIRAGS
ncbi:MAG TPA: TlpA disulfide reductase family protein [Actinomycetota bacterium]|nr:TlpA disulfide reductase family protein [Actinomycetota bacterium]